MNNTKKSPRTSFFKRESDSNNTISASRPSFLDTKEYDDSGDENESPYGGERRTSSSRRSFSSDSRSGNSRGADRRDRNDSRGRDDRRDRDERGSRFSKTSRGGDFSRDGRSSSAGRSGSESRRNSSEPTPAKEAPENIIYGIHPVREAIEIGTNIEKIYIRRSSDERSSSQGGYGNRASQANDGIYTHTSASSSSQALESLRRLAVEHKITIHEVPSEKLDRLTRRNPHQGVVAVVAAIEYADVNEIIDKLSSSEVPALIIAVDGVTDVRNFGAIARSAECAGADAIIMSAKNSAPVNAEAMKSSAGALNIIPVCRVGSLRNTLRTFQQAGMQLVAATEKSNSMLFETDLTKPTVVIMGGEERGISSEILHMCDSRIAIPMLGKIESLNVSAAAAVLLYEVVRQRFEAIEE